MKKEDRIFRRELTVQYGIVDEGDIVELTDLEAREELSDTAESCGSNTSNASAGN